MMVSKTIAAAFTRFKYFRGDCHIRFMLQSNSFQAGQLVIDYLPLTDGLISADMSLTSRSVRNNLLLRAGSTKSGTLVVPYAHLKHFITKDEPLPIATVEVTVMNPLKVGMGDPGKCNLSVFVSFPNAEFKVIDPTADLVLVNDSQGGVASKVTNINIDHVANSSLDMHGLKDSMESKQKGEITGCDRPNIGLSYQPARLMKYPDLANGSNMDYCNRMAIDAGGCQSMNPLDISNGENEMDLRVLTRRWSYMNTFSLHASDGPGTVVAEDIMSPTPWSQRAHGTSLQDNAQISGTTSLLEFLSLPFAMWRGSLEYRFEFITTKIHAARLAFATHYASAVLADEMNEAMAQYAQVFDMTGDENTLEVSVPYRAQTDWCYIAHGNTQDSNPYDMGMWSLRVVNPLITMESVSDVIEVNVYVRAGPDFELRYMDVGAHDVRSDTLIVQGDDVLGDPGVDTVTDEKPVITVAPGDSKARLGNEWYNLRNYFKRSYQIGSLTLDKQHNIQDVVMNKRSIVSYYGSLFRVWFGDVRIRHFSKADAEATVSYCADNVVDFKDALSKSDMGPRAKTDADVGVLDLQIPWYSPYNFCLVNHHWKKTTYADQYYSPSKLVVKEGSGTSTRLGDSETYVAAGENFRFAMLYNVPQFSLREEVDCLFEHTKHPHQIAIPSVVRFTVSNLTLPGLGETLNWEQAGWAFHELPYIENFNKAGSGTSSVITFTVPTRLMTSEEVEKYTGIKITDWDRVTYLDTETNYTINNDNTWDNTHIKFFANGTPLDTSVTNLPLYSDVGGKPHAWDQHANTGARMGAAQAVDGGLVGATILPPTDWPDVGPGGHFTALVGTSYNFYKSQVTYGEYASYWACTETSSTQRIILVYDDKDAGWTPDPGDFVKLRGSVATVSASSALPTNSSVMLVNDLSREAGYHTIAVAIPDAP